MTSHRCPKAALVGTARIMRMMIVCFLVVGGAFHEAFGNGRNYSMSMPGWTVRRIGCDKGCVQGWEGRRQEASWDFGNHLPVLIFFEASG